MHRPTDLVRAERLLGVRLFEEVSDGKNVGAGVHHDEVEDARQVEPRHGRVVLGHKVQQGRDLLHENRVEGQQQLQCVRAITISSSSFMRNTNVFNTIAAGKKSSILVTP